jgi:hypothetical protein
LDADLSVDVIQMKLDRFHADSNFSGDAFVGFPFEEQLKDFQFTGR